MADGEYLRMPRQATQDLPACPVGRDGFLACQNPDLAAFARRGRFRWEQITDQARQAYARTNAANQRHSLWSVSILSTLIFAVFAVAVGCAMIRWLGSIWGVPLRLPLTSVMESLPAAGRAKAGLGGPRKGLFASKANQSFLRTLGVVEFVPTLRRTILLPTGPLELLAADRAPFPSFWHGSVHGEILCDDRKSQIPNRSGPAGRNNSFTLSSEAGSADSAFQSGIWALLGG